MARESVERSRNSKEHDESSGTDAAKKPFKRNDTHKELTASKAPSSDVTPIKEDVGAKSDDDPPLELYDSDSYSDHGDTANSEANGVATPDKKEMKRGFFKLKNLIRLGAGKSKSPNRIVRSRSPDKKKNGGHRHRPPSFAPSTSSVPSSPIVLK